MNLNGLVPVLREHKGVIIGMSAGAINMAETAVCSVTCGGIRKRFVMGSDWWIFRRTAL